MGYEINVKLMDQIVLARQAGDNSYQISLELWMEIAKTCEANGCYKVLGISDTVNPLEMMDAYRHLEIYKKAGITTNYQIAWVEKNPASRAILKFTETIFKNRIMIMGQVFADVSEAMRWLLKDQSA